MPTPTKLSPALDAVLSKALPNGVQLAMGSTAIAQAVQTREKKAETLIEGSTVTGRMVHKGPTPHLTELPKNTTPATEQLRAYQLAQQLEQQVRQVMAHGYGAKRVVSESDADIGFDWDAHRHDLYRRMIEDWRMPLTKTDFEDLAKRCHSIKAALDSAGITPGMADVVMETVIAQLGLFCAERNPRFDSFAFTAAAKKQKA